MKTLYQDRYNPQKTWEVTKYKSRNYYLKQFINGKQFGKGARVTKKYLENIGVLSFEVIDQAEEVKEVKEMTTTKRVVRNELKPIVSLKNGKKVFKWCANIEEVNNFINECGIENLNKVYTTEYYSEVLEPSGKLKELIRCNTNEDKMGYLYMSNHYKGDIYREVKRMLFINQEQQKTLKNILVDNILKDIEIVQSGANGLALDVRITLDNGGEDYITIGKSGRVID